LQPTNIAASQGDPQTVTLITGDRVRLVNGSPSVTPGPGRTGIKFSIRSERGRMSIVPEDMVSLIAADQIDVALFEVTLLLESGYGDQRRDDLPLLVTHLPSTPALARRLASDVIVDRALPALQTVAMRLPKARAGAALASLRALASRASAPGSSSGAPVKIWLDRMYKPLLDHSVPQIGGPAAHARGFTGAGTTVAVLDTGVDSTHPDLAGKVIAAEDFTGDGGGVLDVVGHATHVASIIAGTGAASNGQFAGVAPDAQLLSGRVCAVFGCPESAILAGMSWAVVDHHAKIVNLSLGGTDSPGIDPLEDAVNQLSAQFGALFVIAAGNDGGTSTIESPGSADAAVTVGAVDRDDQLAFFSSRGPRIADRAVKPDVTAPGVGIVAARAANVPPIGTPVGTSYMQLSGTSMATPHVAGAAALLLQQHPDWSGAQLKAQLIASTSPNAALTAFDQGAGRIDVDRGTRQDVEVEPASLSLGVVPFPHEDDPLIVRTVHYRNGGSAPVKLDLTASLSRKAGDPTPAGMIQIAPAQITVPAGGTSDVTVTVTTSGSLDDGLYSGTLVASGGDVRVETPIGVERERESFNLGIDVLDETGARAPAIVFIFPADGISPIQFVDGHASFRLARGRYAVDTNVLSFPGAFLVYPRLELGADTALTFDTRSAKPFAVDIGDPSVRVATVGWQYIDYTTFRSSSSTAFGFSIPAAQLGPDAPPDELVGMAFGTMSDDPFGSPRTIYNLAHSERGHLPSGWSDTLAPDQFATIDARHAGRDDAVYDKASLPTYIDPVQGLEGVGVTLLNEYAGPFQRTERFFAPGFLWGGLFLDTRVLPDQSFPVTVLQTLAYRDYRPGQRLTEQWNQAPFGPAFPEIAVFANGSVQLGSSASRTGDQLMLQPSIATDAGSPARISSTAFDHQHISLFRDGALIDELIDTDPFDPFDVPPEPATYRYEQDVVRPASLFDLSRHITVAWTFRSEHVAGDQPRSLSLPTMRFSPTLDQHGQATGRLVVLPIAFDRPPGADAPPITSVDLEVSFDDGGHWTRAPVIAFGDQRIATIRPPGRAQFVSLRGSASDSLGNRIDQTIIRAFGLAP
jgi:subtilisin family serine protease